MFTWTSLACCNFIKGRKSVMQKLFAALALLAILSLSFPGAFCVAAGEKKSSLPEFVFVGGYPLSSVSGVIRNIAEARAYIHDNKPADAEEILKEARLRLGFIREASPVAQAKDYIWVSDRRSPGQ
jgi:hypothetical protein